MRGISCTFLILGASIIITRPALAGISLRNVRQGENLATRLWLWQEIWVFNRCIKIFCSNCFFVRHFFSNSNKIFTLKWGGPPSPSDTVGMRRPWRTRRSQRMMTAIKDRSIILLQPDGEPPCQSDSSEACPSLCQDCQGQGISPQELRNPIPSQFPIGQLIFSQLLKLIQLINVLAHISSLCKL